MYHADVGIRDCHTLLQDRRLPHLLLPTFDIPTAEDEEFPQSIRHSSSSPALFKSLVLTEEDKEADCHDDDSHTPFFPGEEAPPTIATEDQVDREVPNRVANHRGSPQEHAPLALSTRDVEQPAVDDEAEGADIEPHWVEEGQVHTVQVYGGPSQWALRDCVVMVEGIVGRGGYNYVHIPRDMGNHIMGYAFISFVSVEHAATFVRAVEHQRRENRGTFKDCSVLAARKQRHGEYVNERTIAKFRRIRNRSLWPLMCTVDGTRTLLAPWF